LGAGDGSERRLDDQMKKKYQLPLKYLVFGCGNAEGANPEKEYVMHTLSEIFHTTCANG